MTNYRNLDTRKAMKDISESIATYDGHAHTANVMARHAARLRAQGDEAGAAGFQAIADQNAAAADNF